MTVKPKQVIRLRQMPIVSESPVFYKPTSKNRGIEKKEVTRPPAIYSNLSHEEVLNSYWDQLDVDSQKKYLKEMTW